MINTDLKENIAHIRPFLGVALVISVALLVLLIVQRSTENLVEALSDTQGIDATGTIVLVTESPRYGGLVSFRTAVTGVADKEAQTYVTVVCFQGDELVYQFSARPDVKFLLTDPIERGFEWDGGAASCNASLIYRIPAGDRAELYMLDSVSFEVMPRT